MNKKFWKGLIDWIETTISADRKYIDKNDVNLFHVVDTAAEAIKVVTQYYKYKKL